MRYDHWPTSFISLFLPHTLTLLPNVIVRLREVWLARCSEAPLFSLCSSGEMCEVAAGIRKQMKRLSSVNLSLCLQSCLWVGALWGLRVRGASETSGESCSPSLAFHSLFLLSVFGRDAPSWESSVSGPEAEQEEEAWLQAAELESVKCVVHYSTRCTRSDLDMVEFFLLSCTTHRRRSFSRLWTHSLSAFLTFRLGQFFYVRALFCDARPQIQFAKGHRQHLQWFKLTAFLFVNKGKPFPGSESINMRGKFTIVNHRHPTCFIILSFLFYPVHIRLSLGISEK